MAEDIVDISPKLLQACKNDFIDRINGNKAIGLFVKKVRDGTAQMVDVSHYSQTIGKLLGTSIAKTLTPDALPNGTLYWNIAEAVVDPLIGLNHDLVTSAAKEVQETINKSLGVGLKPTVPKLNKERVHGLLQDVADDGITAVQLDERIRANVENITRSFFDEFMQDNAESMERLGFKTTVTRDSGGKCCEWCAALDGTYDYSEVKDTGNDVWRRHSNCTCTITYKSERETKVVQNYRKMAPKSRR